MNDLIGTYVIVRTYSAGCFAGYLRRQNGKEVEMANARRLWRWEGAASLSQLATTGTSRPEECRFPAAVNYLCLTEAIEILSVSDEAKESIAQVPVWVI